MPGWTHRFDHLPIPEVVDVREDATLLADLGLTSSTMLELLLRLERALEIEIDVEQIDESNTDTVGALADYIVGHLIRYD